jgi:rhodanese-related sulfurtransferase
MQSITTILLTGLLLVVGSPSFAAEQVICTATSEIQKENEASGLFANQEPLFASPAEYRQWLGQCLLPPVQFEKVQRSYVIIDIRNSASYARGHLKGSINMPSSSIKTRLFLKGKNILLLGEAHDRVAMIDSCKKLRGSEFANVKVLQGGYGALANKTGNKPAKSGGKSEFKLPPSKLIFESRYDPWVVIDLSLRGPGNLDRYFEDIYRLNAYPTREQMAEIIESTNLSGALGASSRFIVIDKDGTKGRQFEQWLLEIGTEPGLERMYYLEGGVDAFNAHSKKQQIMLSKRVFVLNRPKGCGR